MKLDFIRVINLTKSVNDLQNSLRKINWPYNISYFIQTAINGWEIIGGKLESPLNYKVADWWPIDEKHPDYIEGNNNNKFFTRKITPGEIGCALSHYQAIYSSYKDGHQNILILEEDFKWENDMPSQDAFMSIPKDASIVYMGRSPQYPEKDVQINDYITKVDYSYNAHAYIVTRKGMNEILESGFLTNLIAWDEFLPAINGTTERNDAIKIFNNPNFKAYSFNKDYFTQTSKFGSTSTTEFTPEQVKSNLNTAFETIDDDVEKPVINDDKILEILDDSDWGAWCRKYINPLILNQEYDLAIDEPCPHVYTFPFFTKRFCKHLIRLGEQFEWTTDRHEFYPTTDNLLEVLGMDKIYNRVINDFVRPLAIDRFQLEGKSWDHLRDESFIIKYPYDQQAHLSLHHDHSNITTLVNLNPGEFEGGGTYFPKFKCNVNPKEYGVMTLHPGNITHKHGARPTTSGTRYVVVSFIKGKDHK